MRAVPILAIALAAITLGCDSVPTAPGGEATTLLAGMVVAPGSVLSVEYRNESHVTFGVSECGRGVEALRGGSWVQVAEEHRICPAALQSIGHLQRVVFRLEVPKNIPDGTYRFRLRAYAVSVAIEPGTLDIVTEQFQVKR